MLLSHLSAFYCLLARRHLCLEFHRLTRTVVNHTYPGFLKKTQSFNFLGGSNK